MPGSGVDLPAALVRMLQIIVGAMTTGCIFFLIIVLLIAGGPDKSVNPSPVLTYVALVFAAAAVVARVIVPGIVAGQARRRIRQSQGDLPTASTEPTKQHSDADRLAHGFAVRTILAAAMLEGAAFLFLVAYMVERTPHSVVFAIILIVALAAHFPTASRAEGWIQHQIRLLDEERSL
jgi:hypothetical protein